MKELLDATYRRADALWRRQLVRIAVPAALAAALVIGLSFPIVGRLTDASRIAPTGPGRVSSTPAPESSPSAPGKGGSSTETGSGPAPVKGPDTIKGPGAVGGAGGTSASPSGTMIAFVSNRDGNSEIYTMRPDGTGQRRLTSSLTDDEFPTWSPDGERIAFVSNRSGDYEVYTMLADGTDVRRVGRVPDEQAAQPAWSPDGRRIAFISSEGPARTSFHRLWLVNIDGSGLTRLTVSGNELAPSWSPDGRWIAFSGGSEGRLTLINPDTQEWRSLEDGWQPAWSPDGTQIAFIHFTQDLERQQLRVMNADGSNARTILATTGEWLGRPAWSPTGEIVFDRDPDGHAQGAVWSCDSPAGCITAGPQPSALWQIRPDGTGLEPFTQSSDDYDAVFQY